MPGTYLSYQFVIHMPGAWLVCAIHMKQVDMYLAYARHIPSPFWDSRCQAHDKPTTTGLSGGLCAIYFKNHDDYVPDTIEFCAEPARGSGTAAGLATERLLSLYSERQRSTVVHSSVLGPTFTVPVTGEDCEEGLGRLKDKLHVQTIEMV
jgi:hypothetical protein